MLLLLAVCFAVRIYCFAVAEIKNSGMSRGGRFEPDRLCHYGNFSRYSAGELTFHSQLYLFSPVPLSYRLFHISENAVKLCRVYLHDSIILCRLQYSQPKQPAVMPVCGQSCITAAKPVSALPTDQTA